MSLSSQSVRPARLSAVELLRFAAAFTVLLAHYNHFYMRGYSYDHYAYDQQPLFWLFGPFYHYGTRAVEVFWCLSGFIFFYHYCTPIFARAMPPLRFFWLRISRLYPLHILTLAFVAILQSIYVETHGIYYVVPFNDLKHFVLNVFFAQNWGLESGISFNTPSWSVSVEVVVYALFFAWARSLRASLVSTVSILVLCSGINRLVGSEPVLSRCVFYFYAGGAACRVFESLSSRSRAFQVGATLAGIAALVLLHRHFLTTQDVDFVLNFEIPLLLVILALNSSFIPPRLAAGLNFLGNLTYASYLLHFPLQLLAMLVLGALEINQTVVTTPAFLLIYLAVVLASAHFVFRYIEMPAQNLLRSRLTP